MRVVAKFGGTSLADGERIERAAESVADAVRQGHEIAVVVSAMGRTTDYLLERLTFETSDVDRADIVGMGERTSVRVMTAALKNHGVNTRLLEPETDGWPVVADESGDVDLDATERRTRRLADDLDAVVPVLTGFLTERPRGVGTLDRGGSDTTAVLLGRYLGADEVVLVSDVAGVMTGDPESVEESDRIESASVEYLRNLVVRGADVVAPAALTYADDSFDVRVVHHRRGDVVDGGTVVHGGFDRQARVGRTDLACLTVVAEDLHHKPSYLASVLGVLGESGVATEGVAAGTDSLGVYLPSEALPEAREAVHDAIVALDSRASVTARKGLGVVRLDGATMSNAPERVGAVVAAVQDSTVCLHDVVTAGAGVAFFADAEDCEPLLGVVRDATASNPTATHPPNRYD